MDHFIIFIPGFGFEIQIQFSTQLVVSFGSPASCDDTQPRSPLRASALDGPPMWTPVQYYYSSSSRCAVM